MTNWELSGGICMIRCTVLRSFRYHQPGTCFHGCGPVSYCRYWSTIQNLVGWNYRAHGVHIHEKSKVKNKNLHIYYQHLEHQTDAFWGRVVMYCTQRSICRPILSNTYRYTKLASWRQLMIDWFIDRPKPAQMWVGKFVPEPLNWHSHASTVVAGEGPSQRPYI